MSNVYMWSSIASLGALALVSIWMTKNRQWRSVIVAVLAFAVVWLPGFLLRLFGAN